MLETLKDNQSNFYQRAIIPINAGIVSHAYFIETNNNSNSLVVDYLTVFVESILLQQKGTFTSEKIHQLILNKSYPDLIEIKPINNIIKKEQILEMMRTFENKSQYGTYQIYIIHEADKMNVQAANTLLKFLEEPAEGIIAILTATNRYRILNTILSRCQILSLQPEVNTLDLENLTDAEIKLFDKIVNDRSTLLIDFLFYYNNLFKTKELALVTLDHMKQYFKSILASKTGKIDTVTIFEIFSVLETEIVKLQYNVNLKLWLDNFLLRLEEV